jgi:hypothetical protein
MRVAPPLPHKDSKQEKSVTAKYKVLDNGKVSVDVAALVESDAFKRTVAQCNAAAAPQAAEGNANPMQRDAAATPHCETCECARVIGTFSNADDLIAALHAPDAVGVSSETPSPSLDVIRHAAYDVLLSAGIAAPFAATIAVEICRAIDTAMAKEKPADRALIPPQEK